MGKTTTHIVIPDTGSDVERTGRDIVHECLLQCRSVRAINEPVSRVRMRGVAVWHWLCLSSYLRDDGLEGWYTSLPSERLRVALVARRSPAEDKGGSRAGQRHEQEEVDRSAEHFQ